MNQTMKNYYFVVFFFFIIFLSIKHSHCTNTTTTTNTNTNTSSNIISTTTSSGGVLDGISHKLVVVNGIAMHVAEKGQGPVILFLHGYPQLWYTWRHQIQALSAQGYRTIAPDLRGYGDTDVPPHINNYTSFQVVGDLVALLDTFKIAQVLLVAHDWGAMIAYYFCMFRPDRIKAFVSLSVQYNPRYPGLKPTDRFRTKVSPDFYIVRFQEPGVAEAEYACADLPSLFKKILTNREPGPHLVPKSIGFGALPKTPIVLPSWLTEEDIKYYTTKYKKTGFTGALNYYRNMDADWELTTPWTSFALKVPVKFVTGDQDMTFTIKGVKEYIQTNMKTYLPNLQEIVILEGAAHFIQEERADEVTQHILDFIKKF